MILKFHEEMRIDVPPERVFEAFVDLDTWSRWMRNFVGAELLTPGPIGVGSQWRETRKMFGKEASEVFEVVAFDPPRSMDLVVDGTKGSSGKGLYRFRHVLVPDGGGTIHQLDASIEASGCLANVFLRLFGGMFRKACRRDFEALKAWLEAGGRP